MRQAAGVDVVTALHSFLVLWSWAQSATWQVLPTHRLAGHGIAVGPPLYEGSVTQCIAIARQVAGFVVVAL